MVTALPLEFRLNFPHRDRLPRGQVKGQIMKKILGGLVLSALLAAPATAADLRRPMPVKAPVPVVTLYSWTGCYIGGHVGYAWGKKRVDPVGFVVPRRRTSTTTSTAFVAGGQVGCNLWQNDRCVFGIEGQASWADMDGSVGPNPPITAGYNGFRTEADIIGSIAARLGYAVRRDRPDPAVR